MSIRLLLFASAREAAGTGSAEFDETEDAPSLGALLDVACVRFGPAFAEVLATSRVWVNGDEPPGGRACRLVAGDEVAVLPPVSGG